MLNTKQRAQLRAMANPLAVTLIIGCLLYTSDAADDQ